LVDELERDERNTRYEEMEKLKDMLKEEETQWTSVCHFYSINKLEI